MLIAERVKALALLVNRVKDLVVYDVNVQQEMTLCHREESAPAYSRVGKNIQNNPFPSALKGVLESLYILGATLFHSLIINILFESIPVN